MRVRPPGSAPIAPRRRTWLLGALVGVVALAYRLLVWQTLRGQPTLQVLGLDSRFYHEWAARLAQGGPGRTEPYFMGPLYPHALALLYALAHPSVELVRWVQAVGGALAAVAVYVIGRRAFGAVAGVAAGLALALYGYAAFLELHLAMEPLLAWLALAMAACTLGGLASRRTWLSLLAGVLVGMLADGRASFLGLLAVLLPAPWIWHRGVPGGRRLAALHAGCVAAGCALAVAPLVLHNARTGGGGALLTTNGGINYYIGNHEGASGAFLEPDGIDFFQSGVAEDGGSIALASRRSGRSLTAAQASRYWLGLGLRWNAAHPAGTLRLWARKLVLLLSDYETPQIENYDQGRAESALLRWAPVRYGWIVALAGAGTVLGWRSDRRVRLLALLLAAGSLVLLPFFITARYRYPLVPMWCLLAGAGAQALVALARRRRTAVTSVAVGATLACAVLSQAARPAGIQASARVMPLYNAGVLAMQQGDFAGAARNFERVLAQQPEHRESQANLGFCLLQTGRVDSAIELLQRVVDRDPENLRVLQLLAHAHLLQGDDRQAEAVLDHMLQLAPQDAWALLQVGDLADRRGDAARAREFWLRAVPSADAALSAALQQRLSRRATTPDP